MILCLVHEVINAGIVAMNLAEAANYIINLTILDEYISYKNIYCPTS
ncbi:MAG: hypothetical protein PSV35_07305 [bacterium]|nr:hypothetical protein [bacterium]